MSDVAVVIDTAMPRGVIGAVDRAGQTVVETFLESQRKHAEQIPQALHTVVAALTEEQRIARVIVGRGPGSFVGVRVGLASALGWAFGWQAEVVEVCSLRALALSYDDADGEVWSCIDARRDQVYVAGFEVEQGRVVDEVFAPAAVDYGVPKASGLVVGRAANLLTTSVPRVIDRDGPNAHGLFRAAFGVPAKSPASGAHPRYCREPSAKRSETAMGAR